MNQRLSLSWFVGWSLVLVSGELAVAQPGFPAIPRVLPPPGIELPREVKDRLGEQVLDLKTQLEKLPEQPLKPDVEVYLKAVDFALRHGEFYAEKEISRADAALKAANERLAALAKGQSPWTAQRGLVVRGYRSRLDGSPQPYGLVIPAKLDLNKPVPLYVWLHGRGDKATDLHFIAERQTKIGQISPPNAIVLHAFGRQCLGFKSAGEVDVLEAIEHAQSQYKIDADRIVLLGFSMGGAGTWHLGAHYADRWVAMSPGAGFVDVRRYQNLKPENVPVYEQKLWGLYDVPDYTRNLFNLKLVAYSGELDKQREAARIMEEAFVEHGAKLMHVIGPGKGHEYHPDSLKQILQEMDQAVQQGRPSRPASVHLQTRTLRYNRLHWVEITALGEHWKDARVDANAKLAGNDSVEVTTSNVRELRFHLGNASPKRLVIDGQSVATPALATVRGVFRKSEDGQGTWSIGEETIPGLAKRHGLQGPIDDAFVEPFLVVTPSGKAKHPRVQQWIDAELAHFQDRWRAVFRGELRMKRDTEVTADDAGRYHLVLWGDRQSNVQIARVAEKLPVNWSDDQIAVGQERFDSASHVPVLIFPNPLSPGKYVVLNSGPTFREAHDKTNSQQNPKLPDWAVVDLSQPPSAEAPGRIAAAGFFDEQWRLKKTR